MDLLPFEVGWPAPVISPSEPGCLYVTLPSLTLFTNALVYNIRARSARIPCTVCSCVFVYLRNQESIQGEVASEVQCGLRSLSRDSTKVLLGDFPSRLLDSAACHLATCSALRRKAVCSCSGLEVVLNAISYATSL